MTIYSIINNKIKWKISNQLTMLYFLLIASNANNLIYFALSITLVLISILFVTIRSHPLSAMFSSSCKMSQPCSFYYLVNLLFPFLVFMAIWNIYTGFAIIYLCQNLAIFQFMSYVPHTIPFSTPTQPHLTPS